MDKKIVDEVNSRLGKPLEDSSFNMRINSQLIANFKKRCRENGTTPSEVLKTFIKLYVEHNS